jgi:DNA-directed RNA polymerase I and III subunit RPAC2
MAVNEQKPAKAEEKLSVKAGQDEGSATFILGDEDHTLGNALRHVLMQTAGTDFCGYSVPHPSEPYVHMRLQTDGEKTASGMLKHGLEELGKSCTVIEDAFDKAFEEHENSMAEDDR